MKSTCYLMLASLAGLIAVAPGPAAWAHAFPEQESPGAGTTMTAPPTEVRIRYDAEVEKLFASMRVIDTDGHDRAAGTPVVSADGRELSVPLAALGPGQYTVKWRVVCVDTHHTEGSFTFTVK